ncbi:MAG: polyribonucleotide nucleotidyltransferase [Anaerolineaceae bacterium]|jgi:polyribonucleotide nucleotidyltransferase|nr:polyribonucleotide nucleotidyltransferase [Anaerolineaceae bacterium]
MKPESKSFSVPMGETVITIETGRLAQQAGGAVTVTCGETMIFAAATMDKTPKESTDFFPLTIDYEERMYAGGRIPGSFFRREGRPSTDAILIARLTDRPIRPLFSQDMRNPVQIIMVSFSSDGINPIDVLGINAASAALTISNIPWNGPIGAVRIGRIDDKFIINPTFQQIEDSDLDLRVAGTKEAISMVECGANEVPDDVMVEALAFAHKAIQPIIDLQLQMAAEIGKPKTVVPLFPADENLVSQVGSRVTADIENALATPHTKTELNDAIDGLKAKMIEEFASEDQTLARAVSEAFEVSYKNVVRKRILDLGIRPDARKPEEIRPIWCEVGYSPRAHGSAIFTRGETQALTLATLGTPREAQEMDNLAPTESKRYLHHYNFPPYSTGEVKPLRGQSRREIGHGALAERALVPVIPDESEFPYTIRLVSEILASNGSSSMASVCGSTLALMDTGVPIKAPVAGIAMGLIKEDEKYAILTDIQGLEDHLGDMDFKVAGTSAGITALQMDIKIAGITPEIMSKALRQAYQARLSILDKMLEVIPVPNPVLKPHAPKITIVKVPVDKIGAIIGPGGKNIRALQEETNTKIDIGEDGSVFIASPEGYGADIARERIEALIESPQIGRIYTGKVVRTVDFGAFVEIIPGTDGLVHISQLDTERVNSVEDIVNVGDEITVMITDIDSNGKIRLSRQAVLEGWTVEEAKEHDRGGKSSGNRSGGQRRGGDRDNRGDRGGNRDNRSGNRGGQNRY